MSAENVLFHWSGGKDSALALWRLQQQPGIEITSLLTSVSSAFQRISMHGVRLELLQAQARSLGLPLDILWMPETPGMQVYETAMDGALEQACAKGVGCSAFGDIFLDDLRQYREQQLARHAMKALFPLWRQDTRTLLLNFIAAGFKAVLVCVDERRLGMEFLGRELDADFLEALPAGVDPCGENGEFHSFVYAGPNFKQTIAFTPGEIIYRRYAPATESEDCALTASDSSSPYDSGFWYLDLLQA